MGTLGWVLALPPKPLPPKKKSQPQCECQRLLAMHKRARGRDGEGAPLGARAQVRQGCRGTQAVPKALGPHAGVGGVPPEEGGDGGRQPLQGDRALLADPAEGFPARAGRQPRAGHPATGHVGAAGTLEGEASAGESGERGGLSGVRVAGPPPAPPAREPRL